LRPSIGCYYAGWAAIETVRKKHICICVCTFKRPQFLEHALEKLRTLKTEDLFDYSIVVVDNDKDQSAKEIVARFAATTSIRVTYAMEPEQNIAKARNRALAFATGDYVAWIDDDEFPTENWLFQFFRVLDLNAATGALGPVEPFFENAPPRWIVKGRFFEKRRRMPTGSVLNWHRASSANVLVRRTVFDGLSEPFRPQFGGGGEDSDFFKRMMERGHTFIWCNEAVVNETIPPTRWTRRYLIRRSLLRGQNGRPFADAISIVKSLVALPLYLLLLPFLLALGQHFFVRFLMKIGHHAGALLSLAGIHPMGSKYLAENLAKS
jgi:succinoglycan biosynthesis protein ExoM